MNLLYEYARMCAGIRHKGLCDVDCPLWNKNGDCSEIVFQNPDEAERLVREWSEAHPEQTYKSYFLERFPKADIVPSTCVKKIYGPEHAPEHAPEVCGNRVLCSECWNRPYKEDKNEPTDKTK